MGVAFNMKSPEQLISEFCTGLMSRQQAQIEEAIQLVSQYEKDILDHRPRGIDVAAFILEYRVDAETILATILADPVLHDRLPDFDFQAVFGETATVLLKDLQLLNHSGIYSQQIASIPGQTEILRRMILSLVKDVRAVFIKLAFRVLRLRQLAGEDYDLRHHIAQETLDVFAPIANRLGVSQLKWELEDLSFRYLQPQDYLKLAKSLDATRQQREVSISNFIDKLQNLLSQHNIVADVAGRPKHLYSIAKKMQKKQLPIDELYDLLAVRVIVDELITCYTVLGVVHEQWQYIPKEFDDYIANPKSNGYQSLHTVVLDQDGNRIEVQIRTQDMHQFAELGVAAHWRYKEQGKHSDAMDNSIASLRQLLEDKDETQSLDNFKAELFYDRVYVLTPKGQLIDMEKGATPLDFAYAVHTEVGHRCRGAKVNGRIVPLTYELQTGEQVEVLTQKEGHPNPQWIDPNLAYLKTARAIHKVKSWIAQQHQDHFYLSGKKVFEKLEGQLTSHFNLLDVSLKAFKKDSEEQLLIAIGRGEIKEEQLAGAIKSNDADVRTHRKKAESPKDDCDFSVLVDGLENVETKLANCCKPTPGDDIVGYISHINGIKIHSLDCSNITALPTHKRTQLISVSWVQRGNS